MWVKAGRILRNVLVSMKNLKNLLAEANMDFKEAVREGLKDHE